MLNKIIQTIQGVVIVVISVIATYIIISIFKNDFDIEFFKTHEKIYILISLIWSIILVISHKKNY